MMKRWKKPPVKAEVRREWLRRYEEDGESPPQIATADRFDVRTVRSQIELAKEEREVREARSQVLRSALENHYADLYRFAERLKSEITGGNAVSPLLRDDPMWSALRQHLPRSSIWPNLNKWNQVLDDIALLEGTTRQKLEQLLTSDARLSQINPSNKVDVLASLVKVLNFQLLVWSREWKGLSILENFTVTPAGKGLFTVDYGSFHLENLTESQVDIVKEIIDDSEASITNWPEFQDMQKLFTSFYRTKSALHDELMIIILRRIVSGRCKYCPI